MRKLTLHEVSPGMVVAKTLYNDRGDPLLRAGVALTREYIYLLEQKQFAVILVRDSDDEDVGEIPGDIVTERVRQHAFRQLRGIYDLATAAAGADVLPDQESGGGRFGQEQPRLRIQDPRVFSGMLGSVKRLIEGVVNAPLLSNLNTLRTHDTYTFYHSVDMTIVAVLLGKRLGLGTQQLQQLAVGGMLHDIGKLFVPPTVLNKPEPLDSEDWASIRQHPEQGYEFLQRSGLNLIDLMPKHIALQHHERQDGTGYPRGLVGTNEARVGGTTPVGQVLPIAEIAAVADVYDALRADRPYRAALAPEKVVSLLKEMAGNHLNRSIVDTLLSVVPVYPLGMEVVVWSGPFKNYRGVVVENLPEALERPRVRLLRDPAGQAISPIGFDLSEHPKADILSALWARQSDEQSVRTLSS